MTMGRDLLTVVLLFLLECLIPAAVIQADSLHKFLRKLFLADIYFVPRLPRCRRSLGGDSKSLHGFSFLAL